MNDADKPGDATEDVVDAEIVEEGTALAPLSPGLPSANLEPDYTEDGVPTFDYVRDKIEGKYTTSVGETELAGLGTENTVAELDKKLEERDKAGADKLEEIRRQLRGE